MTQVVTQDVDVEDGTFGMDALAQKIPCDKPKDVVNPVPIALCQW